MNGIGAQAYMRPQSSKPVYGKLLQLFPHLPPLLLRNLVYALQPAGGLFKENRSGTGRVMCNRGTVEQVNAHPCWSRAGLP